MKPAILLLPLLLVAAPQVETGPDGLRIRTAHYAVSFDSESGLLRALDSADGTSLLTNTRLYNDVLPDGRKGFAAVADEPPKATSQPDGAVVVEVAGKLLDNEGKLHPTYPFAYRATYRFDASPQVKIAVSLIPDFDSAAIHGFAGHVLGTAPQREFFVNTAEGMVSEMAATRPGRTYQSEREPLDPKSPYLGVVLRTGQVLQIRIASGMETLLNTFFHDSGSGPTTLFFCPLSGNNTRQAQKGVPWTHELILEAMPLAQWGKAK